ncbi:hypothetical protein QVZ41_07270 [Wenyingzhuangia sp. chi5]|uniref:Two component regulator propeller n=1 Tax=Wenyingzhuangia gilva TaxID=3057677 RepID=A0ABT8VRR2_9FLAO|nr:hypothetical protein [Wenyingzhuangia sp. chi5]MDO3694644.1 hypothetical protein [Wenyingzhuangia sp. chi5]
MNKLKAIYLFLILSFLILNSCTKENNFSETNHPLGISPWELITEIEGVTIDKPFRLHIDEDNVLWVGTFGNGLMKIEGEDITQLTTENSTMPDDVIYAIDSDNNGFVWGGTAKGLFKYKTDLTVYNSTNSDMILNNALCIAVDESNNIWFGNGNSEEGGLMRFNQTANNRQLYTPDNSDIPNGIINDVHISEDGTVWAGLGMVNGLGGIWRKSTDGQEKVYNTDNSNLNYNWITIIKNDASGNIWSGTNAPVYLDEDLHGGIQNLINDDFIDHNPANSGETSNRVTAMEFDCNGNLWVATSVEPTFNLRYQLSVYNGEKWFVLSNKNFPNLYISDIEIDGETVWLAAPDYGLIKISFKCD